MNNNEKIAVVGLISLGIVWFINRKEKPIVGDTHRLMGLGVQGHSGMNMLH